MQKKLRLVSVEMVATRRLTADQAKTLVPMLEQDLAEYPPEEVIEALKRHREESPFWPALSDLLSLIHVIHEENVRKKFPDGIDWDFRMTFWRDRGRWPSANWGPAPNEPGCMVPAELLEVGHA